MRERVLHHSLPQNTENFFNDIEGFISCTRKTVSWSYLQTECYLPFPFGRGEELRRVYF